MVSSVSRKSLAVLAAALLPATQASPVSFASVFARQNPLVGAIEGCSSASEQKHQPAFDFDQDSCYNAPAVDADGNANPGRDTCDVGDSLSDGCREPSFLENNNVYVRTRCNGGWCAHLYGYYFEVDSKGCGSGHRHDWEHVVVFTEGDTARFVSTSAHGGYTNKPIEEVPQENGHPKIVYHKDGSSTHAMRFSKGEDDEPPENHNGAWFYGGLVSYHGMPETPRNGMLNNDWGSGKIDFSDERFADALDSAKGGKDIPLDVGVDEDGSTGSPC